MSLKQQGYRHEHKFIISRSQKEIIQSLLSGIMQRDPHLVNESYNIRSMYFDDYHHNCYYENENGVDPREKFRIRMYDGNADFIRLELKKKQNSLTQKKQCVITKEQVAKIINGEPLEDFDKLHPLMKKFELQRKCRLLKPDVIVEYDRIPYIYDMGNVRITFDMNIASSLDYNSFLLCSVSKRPILMQDMIVLEVKYDEFLPDYIEKMIRAEITQRTTFSKYYLCKKFSM